MALATNTTAGEIKLAGDLAGSNNGNIPELTNTAVTAGEYTIVKATVDSKGRITNAVNSTAAEVSGIIESASTTNTGVVQVGQNLYITGALTSGTQLISFAPAIGTGADASGLTNDACAVYSIDVAVDDVAPAQHFEFLGNTHQTIQDILDTLNNGTGFVAALDTGSIRLTSSTTGKSSNISITNNKIFNCVINFSAIGPSVRGIDPCELYVKDATDSIAGVVQIGNNISVTNGVISIDSTTLIASPTEIGQVIVPITGNLDVDVAGNISVPLATNVIKGVLSVNTGNGLTITAGVLDFDSTTLPDATVISKGIVQIGSGIDVTAGEISVPDATAISKGIVQIGSGIDVAAGEISVPIATTSTLGTVSIGAGLSVDVAGELSTGTLPDATAISKGIVQVGSGIDVTAGEISAVIAENTILGIVKPANTANITINTGLINTGSNVPLLNTQNTFTKTQSIVTNVLVYAASITPIGTDSNNFSIGPTGNFTLNNFTSLQSGTIYNFIISQDATGSRIITYGLSYKFKTGSDTTLSTAANSVDILSCVSDGTNLYCTLTKDFV